MNKLAKDIVEHVLDELSGRKGLDVEEIVDDNEIYQELVEDIVERVDAVLRKHEEWMFSNALSFPLGNDATGFIDND